MGQRTTQTQPHLEGSRAPWSLIACARREIVSIQTSECEPTSLQTSHNPPNTHSLSRSRGTIQQWRPCRPCRNRRSWRRAECRPHTCLGWWQPARPDPGTGRYWCPAWRTSSLWSPYSWPPGSCPALPTHRGRQTNIDFFQGDSCTNGKNHASMLRNISCFQCKSTAFIILLMPSSAASFNVKKKKKFCIWKWHYNVLFSGFTTPVDAWNFLTVPWGINILPYVIQRYVTLSIQDSFRQMVASGTNRTIRFSCCTSFYYFNYSDWLIRLLITNPWTRK